HTRFSRDWSSDVCSSDLLLTPIGYQTLLFAACFHDVGKLEELAVHPVTGDVFYTDRGQRFGHILLGRDMLLDAARELNVPRELEIGRASCRGRGEIAEKA